MGIIALQCSLYYNVPYLCILQVLLRTRYGTPVPGMVFRSSTRFGTVIAITPCSIGEERTVRMSEVELSRHCKYYSEHSITSLIKCNHLKIPFLAIEGHNLVCEGPCEGPCEGFYICEGIRSVLKLQVISNIFQLEE